LYCRQNSLLGEGCGWLRGGGEGFRRYVDRLQALETIVYMFINPFPPFPEEGIARAHSFSGILSSDHIVLTPRTQMNAKTAEKKRLSLIKPVFLCQNNKKELKKCKLFSGRHSS